MNDELVRSFLALAMDTYVLTAAGGVFTVIRALAKTSLAQVPIYRRILPVLPEALGIAAVLGGGVPAVAAMPIAVKIAVGLWCGYVAQKFQKILGQTVLGDDRAIESKPFESTTPAVVPEENQQ